MSTIEKIKALAARMPDTSLLGTEEATKNALVMPFIAALGYDVFDPLEVVPEFIADVGTKKGEKVDYAIKSGNDVIILIECKKAAVTLNESHLTQLYRYFSVTHARIAVLTNGLIYRFYSDLEAENKMDRLPFLEIDLSDLRDRHLEELAKLGKGAFDLEDMLSTATNLKYTGFIGRTLERQFEEPDEEFIKFFFGQTNPGGRFNKAARELFSGLVQNALHEIVANRVAMRLRSALQQDGSGSGGASGDVTVDSPPSSAPSPVAEPANGANGESEPNGDGIVTTEEELEGYRIVKAIVCSVTSSSRVVYRDGKSYFAVLFDNNNRKPICRLWLNAKTKYVGIFDEHKKETREKIESLEDLYGFAEKLRETTQRYINRPDTEPPVLVSPSG